MRRNGKVLRRIDDRRRRRPAKRTGEATLRLQPRNHDVAGLERAPQPRTCRCCWELDSWFRASGASRAVRYGRTEYSEFVRSTRSFLIIGDSLLGVVER